MNPHQKYRDYQRKMNKRRESMTISQMTPEENSVIDSINNYLYSQALAFIKNGEEYFKSRIPTRKWHGSKLKNKIQHDPVVLSYME